MQNIVCVCFFYKKVHTCLMVIFVSRTYHNSYKWFQTIMNIERLKMCSSNTFHVSDLLKYGRNKLDFLGGISKK